eukprot:TRINITY_DN1717_c0_g1_i1.p1 TRINITY_DN1717_c0_g1~~TRINITY_DN1717_c0_g1_i1.p1  ORF type:complete len:110 (+),score=12.41 TRINITY_DN1717_c0_g1_i1:49-330(+)
MEQRIPPIMPPTKVPAPGSINVPSAAPVMAPPNPAVELIKLLNVFCPSSRRLIPFSPFVFQCLVFHQNNDLINIREQTKEKKRVLKTDHEICH